MTRGVEHVDHGGSSARTTVLGRVGAPEDGRGGTVTANQRTLHVINLAVAVTMGIGWGAVAVKHGRPWLCLLLLFPVGVWFGIAPGSGRRSATSSPVGRPAESKTPLRARTLMRADVNVLSQCAVSAAGVQAVNMVVLTDHRLTLYWAIPLAFAALFAVMSTITTDQPNKAFIAIGALWAFSAGLGIGSFIGSKASNKRR
jgi:hypothetical protein